MADLATQLGLPAGRTSGSVAVPVDRETIEVTVGGDEVVELRATVVVGRIAPAEADVQSLLSFATLGLAGDGRIELTDGTLIATRRLISPAPGDARDACFELAHTTVRVRDGLSALSEPLTGYGDVVEDEAEAQAAVSSLDGPRFADVSEMARLVEAAAANEPAPVTVAVGQPAWYRSDETGDGDFAIEPGTRLRLIAQEANGRAQVVFDNGIVMFTNSTGLVRRS